MEALSSIKIQHVHAPHPEADTAKASSGRKGAPLESVHRTGSPGPLEKPEKLQSKAHPTQEMMKRVAEAMDKYMRSTQNNLEIKIHEGTGRILIKVVSRETGEVIREIPPEEMLDLAVKMEEMAGVLFHKSV
jgi:flagellar protein FlaG